MKAAAYWVLAALLPGAASLSPAAAENMRGMEPQAGKMAVPHYQPSGKPVSATRGESVFIDHCALCHGLHGKGDGPRSAFFQPGVQYIPDLTKAEFLRGRDAELLASIREGQRRLPEPAYVMPQFKYILSEEEIRSVFSYIKTLPALASKK